MTQPPELLYLLSDEPEDFAEAVAGMQPADLAEVLKDLQIGAAANVLAALPFDVAVRVLDHPELEDRWTILQALDPVRAAPLVDAMSDDQRADLFRALPQESRDRILPRLHPKAQEALQLLLGFPPETAGGIMTTEYLGVPATWTADEALDLVRRVGRTKETIYAIYVLAPGTHRLQHVVSLRELVLSERTALMEGVGHHRALVTAGPLMDREEVARLISKYDLLAIPVVDQDQNMLGIVTVDDVIDALVAEQTEDAQKAGGMEALDEPYMEISIPRMLQKRAGWLAALFLGEMLTATAMGYFEHEIERAVVLALFVPLIISSGGNSGSQATSLVIRAMALREVQLRDWWRVAARELPSGLALGAFLGSIGALRILLWQWLGWYDYGTHHLLVAVTVAVALVGVVTFGSIAGSMLPFLIRRLGFDPASASAPFVATLVDVTGLIIYFTVALLILRGTIL
ncbi:MAG TPA: magnesium transporter [Gemmatimonadales bacterium]|nr:magnesium transporter [Gemmatimonadales bacterium]